jgi:hypothetical protein
MVGLVRINDCCTFVWEESETAEGPRRIKVRASHCAQCIEESQRRGYEVIPEETKGDPPRKG